MVLRGRSSGLARAQMIPGPELTKRFGPTVAVDQLSFEIERWRSSASGAQRRWQDDDDPVLTGYHPSSGTAEVAGDVQTQSLEVRRNIGYLPQDSIYPDLRVIEYLRYRAELGMSWRGARRSVPRLAKVGIEDVARRLVGQVSHGYRQRRARGRAGGASADPDPGRTDVGARPEPAPPHQASRARARG